MYPSKEFSSQWWKKCQHTTSSAVELTSMAYKDESATKKKRNKEESETAKMN